MDIYDDLVETWDKHYKKKHKNKSLKYEKDWSCPKCYSGKIVSNFEGYLEKGYNDEAIEVKRMKAISLMKAIDVMIISIRYSRRPTKTYKRISIVIEIIIEKCVRKSAIKYFKELLYLEETIANDTERWRMEKFQRNFNYEKLFAILISEMDNDKFEIISLDESEMGSDDEKSKVKKTSIKRKVKILNNWGIWALEENVSRVIKMEFTDYISEIKFWEEYQKIQENSNEYMKEKLEELMIKIEDKRNKIKRKLQQILELGLKIDEENLVQLRVWGLSYESIKN
ncbi:hypothetical protein C1646_769019 [Rhizophagus diaphanus]|nr:hypothetical protein C1646_769019 [Rhizophagus diaphanus] [Rhizophagus sp. MUCL 43196]